MDEIIKLVSKKAGISEAQAKKAVAAVVDFVDDKLPGPMAKQVTGLLESGDSSGLEQITKALDLDALGDLGSLFGGKK